MQIVYQFLRAVDNSGLFGDKMKTNCFYENGIQFECRECGDCCKTHGDEDDYAYVYLSRTDISRIAAHLNLTEVNLLNTYCTTDERGAVHLAKLHGDCSFLKDGNRCIVYPCRPMQCKTWPFWTENMEQAIWEGPVTACCPGIGQGRSYSKTEIRQICKERDAWYAADDAEVIFAKKR